MHQNHALQYFLHDGKRRTTRQNAYLTRALMNDDLPTFAAPNTYTLRPLRSRKMAEATSETPCPAGLPTRWALTTFRRRWPAVASSHSVTAAVSVPFGNRSTCNKHIRDMMVFVGRSLQGFCFTTQALLNLWQQSTAVTGTGWLYLCYSTLVYQICLKEP